MMQQRTELAIALQNEGGPSNLGHAYWVGWGGVMPDEMRTAGQALA